jgi:hypothetical protein
MGKITLVSGFFFQKLNIKKEFGRKRENNALNVATLSGLDTPIFQLFPNWKKHVARPEVSGGQRGDRNEVVARAADKVLWRSE